MSDLRNEKFGRWTVSEYVGKKGHHKIWKCICECGTIKDVYETNLKSNKTISCGCHRVEVGKKNYQLIKGRERKYPDARTATAAQVWRQIYKDGLSLEQFLELSQQNCHYCGEPPSNRTKIHKNDSFSEEWSKGEFIYNGLDRVDNDKDHSIDNVVVCCKNCNYAKRHREYSEYLNWIKQSYEHLFGNQGNDIK